MNSICLTCSHSFKETTPREEAKNEESRCHYCAQRKIFKQAETLYKGLPSCYACKKLEKEIMKPIPAHMKSHKHNKTSVEFSLPKKDSPGNSKETSLEKTDLKLNISTIFEKKKSPAKKHTNSIVSSYFSPTSRSKFENTPSIKIIKNDSPSIKTLKMDCPSIKMLRTEISPHLRNENSPYLTMKSGAFPTFDQELKKRGIKDLKIFEELSQIMTDGVNSLRKRMIYSSSKHKQGAQEFHELCDKQAPLLFMICLNSGFIFGGYIYAPLDESKPFINDKLSGLYSLFGDKIYFYDVNNHEVKYEKRGFSFGAPLNLHIDLEIIDESSCSLELKYKSPLGAEVTFKISQNFVWSLMIKEICVYKLS